MKRIERAEAAILERRGQRSHALRLRPEVADQEEVVELLAQPVLPELHAAEELREEVPQAAAGPGLALREVRRPAEEVLVDRPQGARIQGERGRSPTPARFVVRGSRDILV